MTGTKKSSSKCEHIGPVAVAKKVVKKRGPIRRRRRILDDRPVDFSGKKYFMVVQRTIPHNERIQCAAGSESDKPFIECKTCRKSNEYVETLESRIERVENATNALVAMCTDKKAERNTTADVELSTIMANLDAESVLTISKQILSLYNAEITPMATSDDTKLCVPAAESEVSSYLSPVPSSSFSLSPDCGAFSGSSMSDYDTFASAAISPLSGCSDNAFVSAPAIPTPDFSTFAGSTGSDCGVLSGGDTSLNPVPIQDAALMVILNAGVLP